MSNSYLRFWGVRGSYAAPFSSHLQVGGNTSCVEIRSDDHVLICDAGTGIIPFGNEIVAQDNIKDMLVILTHYHWDHVCGLPFFVPAFIPDWNIKFFGPGLDANEIQKHFSAQMRAPYFPVGTETWLANITYMEPVTSGFKHGPISIDYSSVHHPGITYGYRITLKDKVIVYISDNECKYIEKTVNNLSDSINEDEQELYKAMVEEEHQAELELIKDADILIHDAQYTPEDYEIKRGWGHSCFIDTITTAIDANVKDLYLYHHDPNYDDQKMNEIDKKAQTILKDKDSSMKCHIAKEGVCIDL